MNLPLMLEQAVALHNRDRMAEAERLYSQILAAVPDHIVALNNSGLVLLEIKHFEEALLRFDRVLAIKPDLVETLNNRGLALSELKRFNEALESYQIALTIDPRHAGVLNNRGLTLWAMERLEEGLANYEAALAIDPNYADALYNRGAALTYFNRADEALVNYERALAIAPEHPDALRGAADVALRLCDWTRTAWLAPQIAANVVAGKAVVTPFVLLGYSDDSALQLQCARNCVQERMPQRNPSWGGPVNRNSRIKIAYLSANFHSHPVAYLIAGLLERHDRSRFDVSVVSFGPDDGSEMRSRLTKASDKFFDVRDKTDHQIASILKAEKIDIAVDLMGHTYDNRLDILSSRPAPVQVNYLGYPGTTGADFMDYMIADRVVAPFNEQPFFSEKIVHLPDCYQANDSKRALPDETPSRMDAGLPEKGFAFCCFNNNWKITAGVFAVWMRLLGAVPGSVLWLLASNRGTTAHLRARASEHGIDPGRIIFAPRVAPEKHLARHRLVDLFLDTLPYNAHTTASDALWMGLPLITCKGGSFAGRVAASLLQAIGLPELVTRSLVEYEALALHLAQREDLLKSFRLRLEQNRLTYPLFDTDRFRRNIEAAYIRMQEIAARGEGPQSFGVEGAP